MKMGGSFFWGVLLVIIGISMIIKVVFDVDIPIFRLIFAFIFIFIGIKVLTGNFNVHPDSKRPNDVIFGNSTFSYKDTLPNEQNIIFGRGYIDLRQIDSASLPSEIEINTVFGSGEVIIRKDMQVRIKIDAVFSGATLPNNNTSAFGSTYYESPDFDKGKPFLYVKISVVFGNIIIKAL